METRDDDNSIMPSTLMDEIKIQFLENRFRLKSELTTKLVFEHVENVEISELLQEMKKLENFPIPTFNIIERAVLRDARITPPEKPHFDTNIMNKQLRIKVEAPNRKKQPLFIFYNNNVENFRTHDIKDVFKKRDDLLIEFERDIEEIIENFEQIEMEYLERKKQFLQHIELLKSNINEYLSSNPQLEQVKYINIIAKEKNMGIFARSIYPSLFKPEFDENTNTLTLFEAHLEGEYHANSSIKIHESGAIIVFVTTFMKYSRRYKYHNAQAYFFFPFLKKFLTRKANTVKDLGEIDDWEISFFNNFGYGDFIKRPELEPYKKCYVCNKKLHYPTLPVRIMDRWVYMLKPCCSCFNKMEHDEKFKEKALLKAVETSKLLNQEDLE